MLRQWGSETSKFNLVNKGQTSHYEWKTSPGMETYDHRFHYPVDSSKVLEEFGTMFFAGVSKSEFGCP